MSMMFVEISTSPDPTTYVVPEMQVDLQTEKPLTAIISPASPNGKGVSLEPKLKRHKRYYLPEGNLVIQVENTLFRLPLSLLHENSPVFRSIVAPLEPGKVVPPIGFNDRRPLVLREISEVDFSRLLYILYPLPTKPLKKSHTVDALLSVLRLATSFQMDRVRKTAMCQLDELPIDPIRKIAIWDEFHLDSDLLQPSFITLCQRSEPLTLPMTMSLGLRNFTKVAMSRDLYRQRVGCCGCRTSLSIEESERIATEIVTLIFAKPSVTPTKEKSLL